VFPHNSRFACCSELCQRFLKIKKRLENKKTLKNLTKIKKRKKRFFTSMMLLGTRVMYPGRFGQLCCLRKHRKTLNLSAC